jgi:hypothetical protein
VRGAGRFGPAFNPILARFHHHSDHIGLAHPEQSPDDVNGRFKTSRLWALQNQPPFTGLNVFVFAPIGHILLIILPQRISALFGPSWTSPRWLLRTVHGTDRGGNNSSHSPHALSVFDSSEPMGALAGFEAVPPFFEPMGALAGFGAPTPPSEPMGALAGFEPSPGSFSEADWFLRR